MPEPLTIYECPKCGRSDTRRFTGDHVHTGQAFTGCGVAPVPVRVFREEDVRPLWRVVRGQRGVVAQIALNAFPAPEEWK